MDNEFIIRFDASLTIAVEEAAYSNDQIPREVEETNAKEVLLDAIHDDKVDINVVLEEGDEQRFTQANQFWQVQDCSGGSLPDHQAVFQDRESAADYARSHVENYKKEGWKATRFRNVDGSLRRFQIYRESKGEGPGTYRSIDVVGPMTYEEMGYDSMEDCLRMEGLL